VHQKSINDFRQREKHTEEHLIQQKRERVLLCPRLPVSDGTVQRVKQKISKVAGSFDVNNPLDKLFLKNWKEGGSMPPGVFKKQMKEAFGIPLTNLELNAAMLIFDKDNNGSIDVSEFQSCFFQLQREERTRTVQRHDNAKRIQKRTQDEVERARENLREMLHTCKMPKFTAAHHASGFKKLEAAAATFNYVKQKQYGGLSSFEETTTMTPLVFRQKLQKTLGIHLSLEETAAVVAFYDSDGDGAISTVKFKKTFFQLQRQTQDKNKKITHSSKLHDQNELEKTHIHKQGKLKRQREGQYIVWQPIGSMTAR